MIKQKTSSNRQKIVKEYLSGQDTFQTLEERYGIKARTIQSWVRAFRKLNPSLEKFTDLTPVQQVELLHKQLQQATLKNELLEQMLQLAEQHTGIDIKKKFGTRQS